MKKFFYHIILFGALFLGLLSGAFMICFQRSSKRINWVLESNKTVFITGDSYPECALNDSILSDAVNLSSSADAYIYSHAKIRRFVEKNPQIKTVILGFSYHNLQAKNDSFFKNTSPGISKFIRYYYLMNGREIRDIFKANFNVPVKGLGSCYQKAVFLALTSIKDLSYKKMGLGEYRRLSTHLDQKNTIEQVKIKNDGSFQIKLSSVQIRYLDEIIQLCKKKRIRLILMNTPIHPGFKTTLKEDRKHFVKYCEQNQLIEAIWDYSDFSMPDSCYADPEHLNEHGADNFSKMIRERLRKLDEYRVDR